MLRALVVGGMLAGIALAWSGAMSEKVDFIDYAELGRGLFVGAMTAQFAAVCLLMPGLAAALVARERERNTLGLLLITNLQPSSILVDKLLARLLFVGLLVLAGAPLVLGLMGFGGVSFMDLVAAYGVTLSGLLMGACVGLLASLVTERLHTALVLTYLALLLYLLVPLVLVALFRPEGQAQYDLGLVAVVHPVTALDQVLAPEPNLDFWAHGLFFSIIAFIGATVLSCRLLPIQSGQNVLAAWGTRFYEYYSRLFRVEGRLGQQLIDESDFSDDPVLWRESRFSIFTSHTFVIRCVYLLVILLGLSFVGFWAHDHLTAFAFGPGERIKRLFVLFMGAYIPLLVTYALFASASAFAGEREQDTLDVLLSTPLSGSRIAVAKILGILNPLNIFCLVPFVFLAALNGLVQFVWYSGTGTGGTQATVNLLQVPQFPSAGGAMPPTGPVPSIEISSTVPFTALCLIFVLAYVLAVFAGVVGLICSARRETPGEAMFDAVVTFSAGLFLIGGIVALTMDAKLLTFPDSHPDMTIHDWLLHSASIDSPPLWLFMGLLLVSTALIAGQFLRRFDNLVGRV